jgi:MraZ protein
MRRSGEKWGQVGPSATIGRPGGTATHEGSRSVFTGEYRHAVDEKGRLAVPARFRAQLAGGAFVSRWIDGCLAIFPRDDWDALAAKVAGLPVTDPGSRAFQRFLFGGAIEAELDRSGRVLVPGYLREWADLAAEAVIVGSRDHAEIWAPGRWDSVRQELDDPARLAEHLTGLGI